MRALLILGAAAGLLLAPLPTATANACDAQVHASGAATRDGVAYTVHFIRFLDGAGGVLFLFELLPFGTGDLPIQILVGGEDTLACGALVTPYHAAGGAGADFALDGVQATTRVFAAGHVDGFAVAIASL